MPTSVAGRRGSASNATAITTDAGRSVRIRKARNVTPNRA